MQDEGDAEWGDGEETHSCILEEPPRVFSLPALTRYRTFAHVLESEPVRVGRREQDFFTHRRRRFEDGGHDASGHPYAQPLPRLAQDSFEVAARQLDTFVWLTAQSRSPTDVLARLAVDRKLGVVPSQATVNRALHTVGAAGDAGVALDVFEDAVLDNRRVALSTVLAAIAALKDDPPRGARLALSAQGCLAPGAAIPVTVWDGLGSALARHALRLPRPLDEHFMALLDATISVVRTRSETLSEALLVDYGRCLLASQRPLSAAVDLVSTELLLGGRSRAVSNRAGEDSATSLQLAAFLSDILVSLCEFALSMQADNDSASARRDLENLLGFASMGGLLAFCGDVVKYTSARDIRLAPKAFDMLLCLCDELGDYHRMGIFFTAMGLLSVPTLRSTLRFVEVMNDVPGALQQITRVSPRSPQSVLVWCLARFPSLLTIPTNRGGHEEDALLAFCKSLGVLLATPAPPSPALASSTTVVGGPQGRSAIIPPGGVAQLRDVCDVLLDACGSHKGARAFLSSFVAGVRACGSVAEPEAGTSVPLTPHKTSNLTPEEARVLEPLNVRFARAFLEKAADAVEATGRSLGPQARVDVAVKRGTCNVEGGIKAVLASSQTYCNVLDVSAVNALAAHSPSETAFVRMMNNYATKTGALALLPAEFLSSSFGMTDSGREMVSSWLQTYQDWVAILPLSLSLQLVGNTDLEVATDLFTHIRASSHQKVALVTADSVGAAAAKKQGVQPVIYLADLLTRLGVQGVIGASR